MCVDLFPGVTVKVIEYAELEIHIREAIEEMKLKRIDTQIAKCCKSMKLVNQQMDRWCSWALWLQEVHILESARKCLQEAAPEVRRAHHEPQIHDQGPSEGAHGPRHQGVDGVLTASARRLIKEPADTHNWIICDGDIDSKSVEALNNVLDDHRLLTMPNGERIQFGTSVKLIFEADNLLFASPATINRPS